MNGHFGLSVLIFFLLTYLQDVYLVVDEEDIAVYKRKDDTSVVHHRFPVADVGTRRIVTADYAGFELYHGHHSIELRCDGGEGEVDKWLSVLQWNGVVKGRQQMHEGGGGGGGGGNLKRG